MAPKFKTPTAFALFILLLLPLSYGIGTPGFLTADSAFGLSTKANPVGTNLIVEIAKKQNCSWELHTLHTWARARTCKQQRLAALPIAGPLPS